MAYKNRYVFIKRTYPNTIILFEKDKKYIGYKKDKEFLKINYIIVRNMEILKHQEYTNNMYKLYYLRYNLTNLINSFQDLIN